MSNENKEPIEDKSEDESYYVSIEARLIKLCIQRLEEKKETPAFVEADAKVVTALLEYLSKRLSA